MIDPLPDFFATPLDALVVASMCIFLSVAIVFCVTLWKDDDDEYVPPIRR